MRSFGITIAYKRFLYKGADAAVQAMNSLQRYADENNRTIQNGYQLFMTFRLGYHFAFAKNRLFIEPSIAKTYWPINTNVPESFTKKEGNWPNYFIFEPGVHFGVKF